ncbi:uncharacterized protein LOC131847997 [Achroia grisella]|uniref:uncharacterized protein LOC131847997 n=1 Tax=Achroia grisella TaxID=688607 RepID=UPI0027D26955|nr:uncharacterized protein LOC131847997 [Achroia grisella]
METSSYLFMSKRKRLKISSRKMEKRSSSESNISLDSLEADFKKTAIKQDGLAIENVDTILVPFYDKDVLIKIPKGQSRKQKQESGNLVKKETHYINSYLVNKERDNKRIRHVSYLEMFRKQFSAKDTEKRNNMQEIRSISPEFGDTERESISEVIDNPATEFYNTECYNEIFYDRLINPELINYLDNSFEEDLRFTEKLNNKSPEDVGEDNFKSVSEVFQPRRRLRRATVEPVPNLKLGGLGPDIEKIKPRLERARSLQRYSEKVRMENRLKIYKKSVQDDIDRKAEKDFSIQHQRIKISKEDENTSYLVNKSSTNKTSRVSKIYYSKSKSAGADKIRDRSKDKLLQTNEKSKLSNKSHNNEKQNPDCPETRLKNSLRTGKTNAKITNVNDTNYRVKSTDKSKGINVDIRTLNSQPPVHISFLLNIGGIRPSSALQQLEEKHKMYQEQIKAFTMENNNNN